jgi:lysophospholipase L1-like esterase
MRTTLLFTLLACVSPNLLAQPNEATPKEAAPFFFQKGDRILFLGDSITEQYQYSSAMELYLTLRFPSWNLHFLNAGISGDTATGGANRFANHVLAEKPTAVTINFGMNDGGYGAFNAGSNANYVKNTQAMLDAAKKAGVRIALFSPNAVDRRVKENFKQYLETQKQYYAPLKDLASKNGAAFVDQYARTRSVLEQLETQNLKVPNPFPDGVHTNLTGGLLMAHTLLTGLHAPAVVSSVSIDATAKTSQVTGATVTKLESQPGLVRFERLDEATPLPMLPEWQPLLPFIDNGKQLNDYHLQVTNIAAGKYTLSIDGKAVGTYAHEQLAAGVNLGNLTTGPLFAQGMKVFAALNDKNKLVHSRFRGVVMFNPPDWLADVAAERKGAELQKRLDKIAAAQAEVYQLAQPKPHQFELKLVN